MEGHLTWLSRSRLLEHADSVHLADYHQPDIALVDQQDEN